MPTLTTEGDEDGGQFKFMGRIPIDMIPMNWSKMPCIKRLFDILNLCFGPHNNNSIDKTDTAKIFDEIHSIAGEMFSSKFTDN